MSDTLFIGAVLCLCVVVSELLVRKTVLRHGGTALVVIVVTAIVANLGVIPAGATEAAPVGIYDAIFSTIAPLGIFWLLLSVRLRAVLRAGGPMLGVFLIGAAGTVLGVVVGVHLSGAVVLGDDFRAIGGMYAATYTGGSVNFNAVALHYGIMRKGALFAGAVAIDAILTAVWMVINIALPRLTRRLPGRRGGAVDSPSLGIESDTEALHPIDLAVLLAAGAAAVWVSNGLAALSSARGLAVPSILILTTIALVCAQFPVVARLRGARTLGMFAIYLFLAVIGAFCNLHALGSMGRAGLVLLVLASTAIVVHGIVVFGAAALLRIDAAVAAVASQANIGGGTSALALARSLGRDDLVLPGILVGSLGSALGTFLGFLVSEQLL